VFLLFTSFHRLSCVLICNCLPYVGKSYEQKSQSCCTSDNSVLFDEFYSSTASCALHCIFTFLFIYLFFFGNNSYISKQYKDKTSELIKAMAECLYLLKQVTLRNINTKIRLKFSRYVLEQLRITNIDHKRWT
jgi:hypothetical protein